MARAHTEHERVTVTVHGEPQAVVIAVEDLDALEETLQILSDPVTMRRLADADADLARGEFTTGEELSDPMAQRRSGARGR